MKRIHKIFFSLAGIGFTLIILQIQSHLTFAQSVSDTWLPPVNISKSGGIIKPAVVVDSNGVFHIVWQDIFIGYAYSYGDGLTWSEPQAIVFPFTDFETSYYFVADSKERIHALWIDDENDLYYARTTVENFAEGVGWTSAQLLARSAIYLDIVTDQNDNIHLAYLRGASRYDTSLAGIYYQRFLDGSTNWSDQAPIDQSPYLRTISQEEANIDLATATHNNHSTVYLTWDNTPKEQIYLAQSDDAGVTWNIPFAIGNPITPFNTPYDIQIQASGNQAMILWKQTEYGDTCSQQYRWTSDNGKTWQVPSLLFDLQYGCPQESYLFDTIEGFLLFTILNEQANLLFWNGSEWSLPQPQSEFDNLADPETNLILDLHFLLTTLVDETLFVIGFDSLNTSDIWSTAREIKETESWFPRPSEWSEPQTIALENGEIDSTKLVVDPLGQKHAFWNQYLEDGVEKEISILYSIHNGTHWSEPVSIFGSQISNAYLHSTAINSKDVLFVVWESEFPKGLFLSWVNADRAYNPSDWVTSDLLPSPQDHATSPALILDQNGDIIITFVIALNEDRGVYLIKSNDGGKTWAEPTQIVDAISMEWAMINDPQLSILQDGSMEALWTVYSLPPGGRPLALYSSHFQDVGPSWSMANSITEGFITWSQVNGVNDTHHRLWLEGKNEILYLWHQYSYDNGLSWNDPSNILTTNDDIEALTSFVDSAKQLHLIFATKDASENTLIHHWLWENEQWTANESLNLGKDVSIRPDSLSATITSEGTLSIIYASENLDITNGAVSYHIGFSTRVVEIPHIELNTILPTQTTEPTQILPTATTTPQLSPTATPPLPSEPNSAPGTWTGLIVGGAIAFIFLFLIVSVGLLIRYRRGR